MRKYVFPLIIITALVYLNSFGNSFVWDDLNNIVNDDQLSGPVRIAEIFLKMPKPPAQVFYRPIPYLTIWLDWHFWKENPFGYHLTNFAFHLACVILIFFLCQRLTQSPKISFVSALIFAVHPVHTEAVSYISGRSDLICGFFIFFSFYLYLHFLDSIDKIKFLYLCTALFSYLAALFSKEIALIFDGAGTEWAEEFSNPDSQNKLLPMYNAFKKTGVQEIICDFCAGAFGVKENLNTRQCPLVSEYQGHPSIEKWIRKGYKLIVL